MKSDRICLPFVLLSVLGLGLLVVPLFQAAGARAAESGASRVAFLAGPSSAANPALAKAYRFDRGGWVYVHLEGSPHDIGYQHGYLLAPEISDAFAAIRLEMTHNTGRDWDFFRRAAREMLWPKIGPEYQAELQGIVDGLQARKGKL
ncbi:MAG: hypothetical protein ACRD41_12850, partial [Candidatus Acidiferrales bacterium]